MFIFWPVRTQIFSTLVKEKLQREGGRVGKRGGEKGEREGERGGRERRGEGREREKERQGENYHIGLDPNLGNGKRWNG